MTLRTRNTWARSLSESLGPVCFLQRERTRKLGGGYDPRDFTIAFFELLLHCHGLSFESLKDKNPEMREIWLGISHLYYLIYSPRIFQDAEETNTTKSNFKK